MPAVQAYKYLYIYIKVIGVHIVHLQVNANLYMNELLLFIFHKLLLYNLKLCKMCYYFSVKARLRMRRNWLNVLKKLLTVGCGFRHAEFYAFSSPFGRERLIEERRKIRHTLSNCCHCDIKAEQSKHNVGRSGNHGNATDVDDVTKRLIGLRP